MQMTTQGKLSKLLKTGRNQQEVEDWILSLTPLGVAFVFFVIFLLPMEIPRKDVVLIIGTAAGFTGLQSYWIFRGWRKNHAITILLGLIGIALAVALVWLYLSLRVQL
jgi:hypothetical protein